MSVCPIRVCDDADAFMLSSNHQVPIRRCAEAVGLRWWLVLQKKKTSHNILTLPAKQHHQHAAIPPDDYSTVVLFTLF
jgi:hypothetical protein